MTGTLIVKHTGEAIKVHATKDHPDSHYNHAVWVDDSGNAYLQVGMEDMQPLFTLYLDEPWATRKEIGKEITRLRKEKGMSVRQLGEILGLSWVAINQIELGKTSPKIDFLRTILAYFGKRLTIVDDD